MQTQSLQRYIIWGALAAVCYLMLIQWQKDYGGYQANNNENQAQEVRQEVFKSDGLPEVKENEDLPTIEQVQQEDFVEALVPESQLATVTVKTNTLIAKIDLEGGDLIGLSLPEHSVDIENPDIPVKILQQDFERIYIAQSGLVGKDGPDGMQEGRPLYKSRQDIFELTENQESLSVPLVYENNQGVKITKTFTFQKDSYLIDITYVIDNQKEESWHGNLFAQIKRDNTIDPLASTSLFAMKPFLGVAYWSEENKYNKIDITDIKDEPLKIGHKGGWAAFVQHYFISAWVAPVGLNNNYTTRVNSKGENIIGFTTEPLSIPSKQQQSVSYKFYAGPKDQTVLKEISDGLDLTVDYGWLWMIAQLLFAVLISIQQYVGNWGWSIVLLTCFVKLIFFPLNQYAFKSMANMRKLQPKMQRLKELYGDDRQKLSQATMEMYRKEKINPLGSCMPMLIQMPVFIALYWVLSESVEIRHAEFILWIKDLSIMDPYFVLPGLMAASMFVQQKLSPMVFQDPMQERVMRMMPFMFAFFFLFFPAGLVLYWLVNNILTIAQQWVINRNLES